MGQTPDKDTFPEWLFVREEPVPAPLALVFAAADPEDLRRRVERAAQLHDTGLVQRLLLTGGGGPTASSTEATRMADLARELGFPESALLVEEASTNTFENARLSYELLRQPSLHGDRILALLVESEPGEAFPVAPREIRTRITGEGGVTREDIEEVEPLAADVRETRMERPSDLKRMARLRIAACILGCRFDDLRQRDQEQHRRRLFAASAVLAVLVVLFGILAFWALRERDRADRERAATAAALGRARHVGVLSASRSVEAEDPLLALLLAREAASMRATPAAVLRTQAPAGPDPTLSVSRVVDLGWMRGSVDVVVQNTAGGFLDLYAASVTKRAAWLQVAGYGGGDDRQALDGLRLVVDLKGLQVGEHEGRTALTTNGGDVEIVVRMEVLPFPDPLDLEVYVVVLDEDGEVPLRETVLVGSGVQAFAVENLAAGTYVIVGGTDVDRDGWLGDQGEMIAEPVEGASPLRATVADGEALVDLRLHLQLVPVEGAPTYARP